MTRVSSQTIASITSAPDFALGVAPPPAPPAEKILLSLQRRLETRRDTLADRLRRDPDDRSLNRGHARVVQALRQLQNLVENVPEGFELAPVYYVRTSQEDNHRVHKEYLNCVRPAFLKYVAENHADDLRRLGICSNGIDRMKKGLDPATADGRFYEVNIDHIVERSGCGNWTQNPSEDPDRQAVGLPRHRVNHFGNLILLTEEVHGFKNELNALQNLQELEPGAGRWAVMMVPKRDARHSGFVSAPQHDAQGNLRPVNFRADNYDRQISHAAFTAEQARRNFTLLRLNNRLMTFAADNKRAFAAPANDNVRAAPSLVSKFNALMSAHEINHADELLRPSLSEAQRCLSQVFRRAADSAEKKRSMTDLNIFAGFYHGKNIRILRDVAENLPYDEAVSLRGLFNHIDERLPVLAAQAQKKPDKKQRKAARASAAEARAPRPQGGKKRKNKRNGSRARISRL